ncbi:MarR family transcriptional regulator [[Clostridium] symbiosum]|uniref:MarR family winged helix-turn-helix transcriptional regulator n=1 Tax=Clostridium symbiosum TaxID=1512 RepID=UPI00210883B3|nr:helix-turn-helix domain-containing protein [[Clostridium] symbiosum]MCQ4988399.1 MarR family transcriptional regulator [[Clostridium] symbiosum]
MKDYREEIRRIMVSVNVIDGIYAMGAKKIGIKDNSLSLLYALDDGKPHSQKEICEYWLIPKTTLNTIVKECVNAGYIVLDGIKHTKEKEIRLTDKGQEYAKTILNQVYELERRAMEKTLSSYSPEFVQALEQFTAYLKEEAEHFSYGE